MIPEFVGRTPVVTQTQALDEDDLVSILTEPKNAVVRQYRKMFQLEDVELEFEDAALHEIARMALARKTGARGLRSICEDVLQQTMFDLPSEEGVSKGHRDRSLRKGRRAAPTHLRLNQPKTCLQIASDHPWSEAILYIRNNPNYLCYSVCLFKVSAKSIQTEVIDT